MTRFLPSLALAWFAGCAELDLSLSNEDRAGNADTGMPDAAEEILVVDVRPSSEVVGALPQSFVIDDQVHTGLDLRLAQTITVSGTVLGFSATPMLTAVGVPGDSDVPVLAHVAIQQEDSIAGQQSTTDEEGFFSLDIPAGTAYEVSFVPENPALLPLFVLPDETFGQSTQLDVNLAYGIAVHGVVRQTDGSTLPQDASVALVDSATGVAGARADVGQHGEFMLRALPGTVELTLMADSTTYIPSVQRTLVIGEEDTLVQQDLDVGILEPILVQGNLQTAAGVPVTGGLVRFQAVELADAHGSLTIVTESITNGAFLTRLLPGRWNVELIPPYDSDGTNSPLGMELEVGQEEVDLGTIKLPERVSLFSVVLDAELVPQSGVVVTAREIGFDGYTYSATSDSNGELRLAVPPVPLSISMTPPDTASAITWFDLISPDAANPTFMLARGHILEGSVSFGGDAVPFSLIEIRDGLDRTLGTTITDGKGRFAVRLQGNDI